MHEIPIIFVRIPLQFDLFELVICKHAYFDVETIEYSNLQYHNFLTLPEFSNINVMLGYFLSDSIR